MDKLLYMVLGIFCMGFSYAFLRSLINSPEFVKSNYRNATIPSLGGLVVLISLIISGLVIRAMNMLILADSGRSANLPALFSGWY